MNKNEARMILLEQELTQAYHTISFLHGCLTEPRYVYGYPEQTTKHLADIEALIGPLEESCTHSTRQLDCPSCLRSIEQREKRDLAERALAFKANSEQIFGETCMGPLRSGDQPKVLPSLSTTPPDAF